MVIDPGLPLGRPVPIDQWMTAIGAQNFKLTELAMIKGVMAIHDQKQEQQGVANDDKTLMPKGLPPIAFVAPSNVYDLVDLGPQDDLYAETRFLTEGQGDLERDHKALETKRTLLQAIHDRHLEKTLDTLPLLAKTERGHLLNIPGFQAVLQQSFNPHGLHYVMQEFVA
jgi:hypothetical protein